MYVCMYVCTYVRMCVHSCLYTLTHMYTCPHLYICIHICVTTTTQLTDNIIIHTRNQEYIHTYIHTYRSTFLERRSMAMKVRAEHEGDMHKLRVHIRELSQLLEAEKDSVSGEC
jgi:hypothetical protein